jgi:hypothetical protein
VLELGDWLFGPKDDPHFVISHRQTGTATFLIRIDGHVFYAKDAGLAPAEWTIAAVPNPVGVGVGTSVGEGAAVPKTFAVCRDLDYLYAKASTAHNKLHKLQEKLAEQCKKVSKIIKTCNKIDKIKEQTGTAESTLKTLKNLPYIGPVLKLIYPIVRNVKEGTKVASNCKKFVKNLNLKNLKKNCKKAVRRMKDADMRISLIFADLEVAQELWCSCKAEQTEYQADVKRGCERAEEIYKSGNEKFGNCTEPVKCPLKSNARALAIRCPNTVRPVVEKFSDIVDQDVARLRVAVDTTERRLRDVLSLLDWLKKLDFTLEIEVPVVSFFNILSPLAAFVRAVKNALDRTITIRMPGCPSDTPQGRAELQKLTEAELNERVLKATGMNLTQAMKPIDDYAQHPEVLKVRQEFKEKLQYRPIGDWYRNMQLQKLQQAATAEQAQHKRTISRAVTNDLADELSKPKSSGRHLDPFFDADDDELGEVESTLKTDGRHSRHLLQGGNTDPANAMLPKAQNTLPKAQNTLPNPSKKSDFCADVPDTQLLKESAGSFPSCSNLAAAGMCKKHEDARRVCPKSCGLCPAKMPKILGTCKISSSSVKSSVVHAPEDAVPFGYVDYQPLQTTDEYCIPGNPNGPAKPYKALKCHTDGTLNALKGIYCHDPAKANDMHRWVLCETCKSEIGKQKKLAALTLQDILKLDHRSDDAQLDTVNGGLDDALSDEKLPASRHTRRTRLVAKPHGRTQKLWGHWHIPHRWHVHIPHRHHFHIPHRWHVHVPHRWHVHIPHRHHFHIAAIAKAVGGAVVGAIKKIGELYCYAIKFNVMDIIKGIGSFLSWMMKPIEIAMKAIFSALGITLPSIPGLPTIDLGLPPFPGLLFDFGIDFLNFNWDIILPDIKKLCGFSFQLPNLPTINLPSC